MPQFFDRYIRLVEEQDLSRAFEASGREIAGFGRGKAEALGSRIYAPGKWTVADVLQHVIDNERIQSYRALRIARGDTTPLPGYEESVLAAHAETATRTASDLLEELQIVRCATHSLFARLSDKALSRTGLCNNIEISPLALAFVVLGHQTHHFRVLEERYFPLLGT